MGKPRVGSGSGFGGPGGGSGGPGGGFVTVAKVKPSLRPLRRNHCQDHQNHHQDHQNHDQNPLGVYPLGVYPHMLIVVAFLVVINSFFVFIFSVIFIRF